MINWCPLAAFSYMFQFVLSIYNFIYICCNIKLATPRIDGNHAEFISVRQLLTELLLSFPLCHKGQKISEEFLFFLKYSKKTNDFLSSDFLPYPLKGQ